MLRGRPVELWLDKACLDQTNIADALACLPVYLAGCKRLLVIAWPTYVTRLWCAMEIFTFLLMGGHVSRIALMPIAKDNESAAPTPSEAMGLFSNFDVLNAYCYLPEDRQRLLGVIEAGFGGYDGFNELVRQTFTPKVTASKSGKRIAAPEFRRGASGKVELADLAVDGVARVWRTAKVRSVMIRSGRRSDTSVASQASSEGGDTLGRKSEAQPTPSPP
jgi:hypothetical protein